MRKMMLGGFLLLVCAQIGAQDWWDSAWQYRQRVYINGTDLEHDVLDFPLTIRLDSAAFVASHALPDGADLAAVADSGERLPVEIVQWKSNIIELVVRVAQVEAGKANQSIDLYFGNAQAAAQPISGMWDGHYVAVLHLDGDLKNDVSIPTTISVEGSVALGETASFEETPGYIRITSESLAGLADHFTVAVRFLSKANPGLQTLASGVRMEPLDWFNFGIKQPNIIHTNTTSRGQTSSELNPTGVQLDSWHTAIVSYDAAKRTRTICIDGSVFQRDAGLNGPIHLDEVRIGRGLLHFDPWQFHGEIDEVRISSVARADDWLRLEAGSLGNRNPFVAIGAPQHRDEGPEPPGAFNLLEPFDTAQLRSRELSFRWQPSAGADSYRVQFFENSTEQAPIATLDAGAATRLRIPYEAARGSHWSVEAESPQGVTQAKERRAFTAYDWSTVAMIQPSNVVEPQLNRPTTAAIDISGYLRGRANRVIQRWFLETPESSPAMLQVFRDRDKTPLRDPLVPWAGEFAGKFLTAAELNWRVTGDPQLKAAIDAFVQKLIACQADNGYLGPFPESSRLTGSNWDVWGHYHCMLGLMLYYDDTHFEPALDACKKAADLLFETFGPNGPSLTNDGGGGQMNMSACHGLVLLYRHTGIQRYLDLALYIINDAWNEPTSGQYIVSALAGKPIHEFTVHRWEALHGIQALAELYWLTGNEDYRKAFEHIWWSCVRGDRHNTGGFTSGEGMVGSPYNQGAIETCCTVAWSALSVDMLRLTGDSRVADELEWSLFNSALGAIPYSGRACAYNVPMDGTRVFGVELPWQAPKGGPDLNCCSVNAPRPVGMISDWGVMAAGDDVTLNYLGPCTVSITRPSGAKVSLRLDTKYPAENHVVVDVDTEKPETFTLHVRVPKWSKTTSIRVNDAPIVGVTPGAYAALSREWKSGDRVAIDLDFSLRFWAGDKEYAGKVSVYRGPLLLAFDGRYNDLNPDELPGIEPVSVKFEEANFEGDFEPWVYGKLLANDGVQIAVVDLSSAGQTGNHYRSWLPGKNLPPSPFSIDRPVDGVSAGRISWSIGAGAETYEVLVSASPDMEGATPIDTVGATELNDSILRPGVSYVDVRARNSNGETSASNGPLRLDRR